MSGLQYAVRTKHDDGQDVVVEVGDEALMRKVLAENLLNGNTAEPLIRNVQPWAVDQRALTAVQRDVTRDTILAGAIAVWEDYDSDDALGLINSDAAKILMAQLGTHDNWLLPPDDVAAATAAGITVNPMRTIGAWLVMLIAAIEYRELLNVTTSQAPAGSEQQDALSPAERAQERIDYGVDALAGLTARETTTAGAL